MLKLRPSCEQCNKNLPANSTIAMICSYECTYCQDCAINVFENVCPSCSGNFVPRPIRPAKNLEKNPASTKVVFLPKDLARIKLLQQKLKNIKPEDR